MRITQVIAVFFIGVIFGVIYTCTFNAHSETPEPPKPEIQYVYIEKEPEVITETIYVPVEEDFFRNHTEKEEWYVKDLAMREGEGEGVIGMLWIMYCLECRCKKFNHTIEEEWAGSAFITSMNRSGLTPNENCEKAYELFREGWKPEPLYFGAGYYHGFATDLCQVGNHCFSY